MQRLSEAIVRDNITINTKNSAILKTKYELGEICQQKAIEYLDKKDANISKVFSKTYQIHTEIINDYERLYSTLSSRYEEKKKETIELNRQVDSLKTELNKERMAKAAIMDAGENIEKQFQSKHSDYEKLKKENYIQLDK